MAVVINEFEAIAEPTPAKSGDSGPGEPKRRIELAELRRPLRLLGARQARVWAH